MRTIGQAFDVVHRIVEAEKDQNNNLDNMDKDEIEKEIVFSPRKSIKSNKVKWTDQSPGISLILLKFTDTNLSSFLIGKTYRYKYCYVNTTVSNNRSCNNFSR